jgi:mono/diheme cytochrome c family protein
MRAAISLLALSFVMVGTACSSAEEEGPSVSGETAMQAQEDSVMMAAEMYDETAFDSISWDSFADAQERGRVVFQFSCRKCHGDAGLGDGGFVRNGDTLQPPNFVVEDWRFAEDRVGLRKQVFTGTAKGMPHWGFYGLKYRDIDAVATYIQEVLRQDLVAAH